MKKLTMLAVGLSLLLAACSTTPANSKAVANQQCGGASWYALHGRKTASGARMNMHAMTVAHKTLPFGTKLRVTNQRNGKSVVVRVNDRGPFIRGRKLDLSKGAAAKIGMISSGHAKVCYNVVK